MDQPTESGKDDSAKPKLMAFEDALREVLARAERSDGSTWPSELVDLADADGRVLARDVVSALDMPAWDNSAMDGYAVRLADVAAVGQQLPVSARVAAGGAPCELAPGSAARIFTGAPMPRGADAVVIQERVQAVEDGSPLGAVRIMEVPRPGANIRRAGEELAKGAVALARGARLGPASLGVAASTGAARLLVAKKPRVAFFSTGDELALPGAVAPADLAPGAIFNSSRYFLRALVARLGCEPVDLGVVGDTLDATKEALSRAAEFADVAIASGGVGGGEEDHVKTAVRELGELSLWQLAIKPGKPFAMGRVGVIPFIGLPGNPVACMATFLMLARPFLLRLQGVQDVAPLAVAIRAGAAFPAAKGRREFIRARLMEGAALPLANQSSACLTSMAHGEGLVDIPPGAAVKAGDLVSFIPFSSLDC